MNNNDIITVDHVSMHFNMSSERLDSLKEYVIKLCKRQLFFEKFVALDDVSFTVSKGTVVGIVGLNGSGKSTILKCISGILKPSEGTIKVHGTIAPLIELGAGFDLDLSARENIFLNGSVLGYSKQLITEKFDEIVAFSEMQDFLDVPMKNYSSGMVARVAFAVATIFKPDILIADEILSVGDFLFQQKCEDRIKSLMAGGTTVLIVSHSINQIESLCSDVVWLDKGKIKMVGDTKTVCEAYKQTTK